LDDHKKLRELLLTLEDVKENFHPWKMGYYRLFLFIYTWILLSAVLLGVLLSRSVTGRVAKLVEATKRAAEGDLDVRVPVRGRDEIGGLSDSFNSMLDEIQRGRDRIVYLEKVSSWQEIARRLAHEIKNPLTPIQLAVQELHKTYRGDDEHFREKLQDSVEIVREEVESLRHMVQTFSEFAKLPSVHTESTDLNEFVTEFLKHNLQYSDSVHFFPAKDQVWVQLDHILMGRVLTNLINNGLEASPEAARLEVHIVAGPGWGTLRIVDHGKGMTEDVREQMFQPYFTTKAQGTGLGLAIVKKIVLQHGGEISVLDGEESGTVVDVRLRAEKGSLGKAERGGA
jgi:nitrogen fixation/metabolism regulation signal transduction histidine kinase